MFITSLPYNAPVCVSVCETHAERGEGTGKLWECFVTDTVSLSLARYLETGWKKVKTLEVSNVLFRD